MEEIWQPIINFEDTHEISNTGRIRSINRSVVCMYQGRSVTKSYKSKELNLITRDKHNNYIKGRLRKNGKYYQFNLHLLVWDNFYPNTSRDRKHIIKHIDGDRSNNRLDNLAMIRKRWTSHRPTISNPFRGVIRVEKYEKKPSAKYKWSARISVNGKIEHLGVYDEPEEAHIVYQTKLREIDNEHI